MIEEISKRAVRVHKEAVIIDMCESFTRVNEEHIGYFQTLADSGVSAIHATVPDLTADLETAINKIAKFYHLVERSEHAIIVRNLAGLQEAKKRGKVAIMMGMQNSTPIEKNLELIRVFEELGLKVMQIAYAEQNYLGAGCTESADRGLTDLGRKAVKEMNRRGVLIDVSHCGDVTARDTIEASSAPIAITHATPAALVDILRAKEDDTLRAVAQRGGVIGQAIYTSFCEKRDKPGLPATLDDFIDILDYLVQLVGIDHVGLGLDISLFNTQVTFDAFWAKIGRAHV
jgi:membrane dipeptidase